MLRADVLPKWHWRDGRTITSREVIELLDKVVERGAPVMANNLAQMLGHMFKFAIHRGTLENSPVQLLYRPGGKPRRRKRVLSEEELRSFIRKQAPPANRRAQNLQRGLRTHDATPAAISAPSAPLKWRPTSNSPTFVHERHWLGTFDVARLELQDGEPGALNQLLDGPIQVAAPADTLPSGCQPILPLADSLIRRPSVLDKQKLTVQLHYAAHSRSALIACGIVHSVQVVTTVSMLWASSGID